MLIVRDYNKILDDMSDFENQLFSEHLSKVNTLITRGLKILRWSS